MGLAITDDRECRNCSPESPYCAWELAPDDSGDSRGWIVVTDNGEIEVTGRIMDAEDAHVIAAAFNALHRLGHFTFIPKEKQYQRRTGAEVING